MKMKVEWIVVVGLLLILLAGITFKLVAKNKKKKKREWDNKKTNSDDNNQRLNKGQERSTNNANSHTLIATGFRPRTQKNALLRQRKREEENSAPGMEEEEGVEEKIKKQLKLTQQKGGSRSKIEDIILVRPSHSLLPPPVTRGIKSLTDLYAWRGDDDYNRASIPLQPRIPHNRPKLLVCHDMMGGYVQDCNPQGMEEDDIFALYHWHLVDMFVYFAHDLVSFPPPVWTNVAHRNGVKSLGTFITEWEEGKKVCEDILSEGSIPLVAKLLVDIMNHYNFDGWLINIENNVDSPKALVTFVEEVTRLCHEAKSDSVVLWYDAVTIEGHLHWQNELNEKNKSYFDVCDGIFLNYTWSPLGMGRSKVTAKKRVNDVFVGIDAFGRNTYGGGKLSCSKALEEIQKHGLSTALFAPGWTFECLPEGKSFDSFQLKFWEQFEGRFAPKLLASLPFSTSFSRGHGDFLSIQGKVVHRGTWSNLSYQNVLHSVPSKPTLDNPYTNSNMFARDSLFNNISIGERTDIAFNGSSCCELCFSPSKKWVDESLTFQVLHAHFPLKTYIVICCTFSIDDDAVDADLTLQLVLSKIDTHGIRYMLFPLTSSSKGNEGYESVDSNILDKFQSKYGFSPSKYCRRGDGYISFLPQSIGEKWSHSAVNIHGKHDHWQTRTFVVAHKDLQAQHIQAVRIVCKPRQRKQHRVNIGQLSIFPPSHLKTATTPIDGLTMSHIAWSDITAWDTLKVTLSLSWLSSPNAYCYFIFVTSNFLEEPHYLGMAHNTCYRITLFPVATLHGSNTTGPFDEITFIIQPKFESGLLPPLTACSSTTLRFQLPHS
eukprot:m.53686 g.53686  ORF g.53686 m.53686 type:complete len:826 (+) comp7678_c0_seq1:157-2634(+)